MASPQSFGDFFTRAFEWIKERVSATVTWLTQDRTSIREELTERMRAMERRGNVNEAHGRNFLGNSLTMLQDRLRHGGVTPETRERMSSELGDRLSRLPQEDQDILRDVRRLGAAGGFSDAEMETFRQEAQERNRRAPQRER